MAERRELVGVRSVGEALDVLLDLSYTRLPPG